MAILLSLGIIVIGLRFLVAPEASAVSYGVPVSPEADVGPYPATKGLRDLSFGIIGLTLLAIRQFYAAGWVMIAVSVVPFGDTVLVLLNGGSPAMAYGVHGVTGLALLAVGGLLAHGQRPSATHRTPKLRR